MLHHDLPPHAASVAAWPPAVACLVTNVVVAVLLELVLGQAATVCLTVTFGTVVLCFDGEHRVGTGVDFPMPWHLQLAICEQKMHHSYSIVVAIAETYSLSFCTRLFIEKVVLFFRRRFDTSSSMAFASSVRRLT